MRFFLVLFITTTAFAQQFRWGADLSFVPKLEHNGVVYRTGGEEHSALEIFRCAGFEVVRLRLWHTPVEPWHGIDSVLAFAERADALGFKILLDIHYSDTWADPEHQTKPAAWQSLTYPQLLDSMYRYTNNVMLRFRNAGVIPEAVQIGNEVGGGFLWETGRLTGSGQQWEQFTTLLDTAIAATRDSLPQALWPKIVIHHQEGGDASDCHWFFINLFIYEVDYDIIGLSYYPWWHGDLGALSDNLRELALLDKEIRIVETAYPYSLDWCDNTNNIVGEEWQLHWGFEATEEGQAMFLNAVAETLQALPNNLGTMVCLWEPAWIPTDSFGSPWENLALFDCDGNKLLAFDNMPIATPQRVTLVRIDNDLRLRWQDDGSFYYHVYGVTPGNPEVITRLGVTAENQWLLPNEFSIYPQRSYFVIGSCEP